MVEKAATAAAGRNVLEMGGGGGARGIGDAARLGVGDAFRVETGNGGLPVFDDRFVSIVVGGGLLDVPWMRDFAGDRFPHRFPGFYDSHAVRHAGLDDDVF